MNEKVLCTFEQDGDKINIKEIKNFTTEEVFNKSKKLEMVELMLLKKMRNYYD